MNTLDDFGRPRFIVYDLDYVFKGQFNSWYKSVHTEPILKVSFSIVSRIGLRNQN